MSKNGIILLLIFLFAFDAFLWWQIVFGAPPRDRSDIYFLNVGQGDSELLALPGNIKVLIDGGPNKNVIYELEKVLKPTDRYIDLVILTHSEADHLTGLIDVFKRHRVGVFIFNGRLATSAAFEELTKIISQRKIPIVILSEGNKIAHLKDKIIVIAPDKNNLKASKLNDTSLVLKLESQGLSVLFTGDIGNKIEKSLLGKYASDLNVDILKVAHHGSKYSSSPEFLKIAAPKLAIIEVGKNSYGHPTAEVLNRLASIGSQVFRTDLNGTLKLILKEGKIYAFAQK